MMIDGSAPIHKKRNLVKIYKNVLPRKRTVVVEVYGKTYSYGTSASGWMRLKSYKQLLYTCAFVLS